MRTNVAMKRKLESHSTTHVTNEVLRTRQRIGIAYDARMRLHKHEWFSGEQENPKRISSPFENLCNRGLLSRCVRVPAKHATEADLLRVHSQEYISLVKRSAHFTLQQLYDLSGCYDGVFFNSYTWAASSLAAGTVQQVARLVAVGQLHSGLALVRPPGHHAMYDEACGYCIFNNVAVAASSLLGSPPKSVAFRRSQCDTVEAKSRRDPPPTADGLANPLQRILIVDWDVHQGQGTQYTFYRDKRVLFISIHRYEKQKFWPNLREGEFDFIGDGDAAGYNINIPLNKTGMTDSDYLHILHNLIMPVAYEFNPELVFVSSGFDAAVGCAEGKMWLSPACYGHMLQSLRSLAGGRIVVALEGGYFIDSLSESCVHVIKALLGDALPPLQPTGPASSSLKRTISACVIALRAFWMNLNIPGTCSSIGRPDLSLHPVVSWPLIKRVIWPEKNPTLSKSLTAYSKQLLRRNLPNSINLPRFTSILLILPMRIDSTTGDQLNIPANHWATRFFANQKQLPHRHFFLVQEEYRIDAEQMGHLMVQQGTPTQVLSSSSKPKKLWKNSVHCVCRPFSSVKVEPPCDFGKKFRMAIDLRLALQYACKCIFKNQFTSALIAAGQVKLSDITDALATVPASLLLGFRSPSQKSQLTFPYLTCELALNGRSSSDTFLSLSEPETEALVLSKRPRTKSFQANRFDKANARPCCNHFNNNSALSGKEYRLLVVNISGVNSLTGGDTVYEKSQLNVVNLKNALRNNFKSMTRVITFDINCAPCGDKDAEAEEWKITTVQHTIKCHIRVETRCRHEYCSKVCSHTCANLLGVLNSIVLPMGYNFSPDLVAVTLGRSNFGLQNIPGGENMIALTVFLVRNVASRLIVILDPDTEPPVALLQCLFNGAAPPPICTSGMSTSMTSEVQTQIRQLAKRLKRGWSCFPIPDKLPFWEPAKPVFEENPSRHVRPNQSVKKRTLGVFVC